MSCCKCDNPDEHCKNYIDFPEDDNCILVAIENNDKLTLQQVGDRLGISAERVRQLEKRALKKLKRLSENSQKYDIREFLSD